MLYHGMTTLTDVVNEDNAAMWNLKVNVECFSAAVFGADGLCFCMDTCTSSTDPIELVRAHA